jgi:transcriptional regulator with XRE-family HTH domain/DNA polymerase III delta prime subunit
MEKRKQAQNWRLHQARERRSWTQREVADQIDLLDVRTLRRWEAGEAAPSPRYRARLCELFAMNVEELGLLPNVDSLFLAQEDQRPPESPQLSSEERYPPSAFPRDQPVSGREKWNRQQLLKKVYSFWVKGLLEQSLREAPYLKLDLCACPGMVTIPWTQVVQQLDRSIRPLSPGTHIAQIYDDAGGELLILGEPGAGKTTLLIELARDLLDRASENEAHPIPVIFNLSSWPLKQQLLATWLVEELNNKYQVPQQVGLVWVEDDHILPLLDGLDEVSPAFRKTCVDAINAYRWQHGLVPLVLCSRREEYLDLGAQILLRQAIYIQPLTQQHIEDYLVNSGDQLATLQSAVHDNTDLQKIITTPLMLNILAQTYGGKPVERCKDSGALETRRKQMFTIYVERMLNRRKPASRYSVQQNMNWQAYLAREMKPHSHTEFDIERMQLDWRLTSRLQRLFHGLFIGLCAGLLGSVLIDFIAVPLENTMIKALVIAPGQALTVGIIAGIAGVLCGNILSTSLKRGIAGAIAGVIIGGSTIWVGNLLGWAVNVLVGTVFSVVIILVFLLLSRKDPKIQQAEVISWPWMRTRKKFPL